MQLPALDFLMEGNSYTGSEGEFRYQLQPTKEQTLRVWAYPTYCFSYCQEHDLLLGEETFPLDQAGMDTLVEWLEQKKNELLQN